MKTFKISATAAITVSVCWPQILSCLLQNNKGRGESSQHRKPLFCWWRALLHKQPNKCDGVNVSFRPCVLISLPERWEEWGLFVPFCPFTKTQRPPSRLSPRWGIHKSAINEDKMFPAALGGRKSDLWGVVAVVRVFDWSSLSFITSKITLAYRLIWDVLQKNILNYEHRWLMSSDVPQLIVIFSSFPSARSTKCPFEEVNRLNSLQSFTYILDRWVK